MAKQGARRPAPRGKVHTVDDRQQQRDVMLGSRGAAGAGLEEEVNKEELIELVIENNPDKSPTQLRKILREEGVQAGLPMIEDIRSRMVGGGKFAREEGRPKGQHGRKPGEPATGDGHEFEHLGRAFEFIHQVGGINRARQLLDQVGRMLPER